MMMIRPENHGGMVPPTRVGYAIYASDHRSGMYELHKAPLVQHHSASVPADDIDTTLVVMPAFAWAHPASARA